MGEDLQIMSGRIKMALLINLPRCPKCLRSFMRIIISEVKMTPYGDEMVPTFDVSFVCNDDHCGFHMIGFMGETLTSRP